MIACTTNIYSFTSNALIHANEHFPFLILTLPQTVHGTPLEVMIINILSTHVYTQDINNKHFSFYKLIPIKEQLDSSPLCLPFSSTEFLAIRRLIVKFYIQTLLQPYSQLFTAIFLFWQILLITCTVSVNSVSKMLSVSCIFTAISSLS